MKKHVLINIKSLGNEPTSVITEIGAIQFDGDFNFIPYTFNNSIIKSQLGRTIDENVVDNSIQINKLPLPIVLRSLSSWIIPIYNSPNDNIVFWGRNINAQLSILNNALDYYGIVQPWKYSDIAEVSTINSLKSPNEDLPIDDITVECKNICTQQLTYLKAFSQL